VFFPWPRVGAEQIVSEHIGPLTRGSPSSLTCFASEPLF